jgi:glycosyltransferase involved in cell wall biosynthesis
MYKKKTVGVVIPAYNVETLVGRVIETMPGFIDHLLIVDDASKDGTTAIIKNYQKKDKRIILIKHAQNQGVGGAIASGYKWCREHDLDVAVVMAGDAQMDPADLPTLLEPVITDRVDYSKGNRLFTGDAWTKIPRIRYLGNSALSLLTKIASGYWHLADSQCGYTAANKKILHTIDWDQMYKRYGMPNDLLVRLNIFNFRVADVPVKPVYHVGEKSGFKALWMIPRLSLLLTRLFFFRMFQKYIIRDFHPLVLFYFIGFILTLVDIAFLVRFFIRWNLTQQVPEITLLTIVFCTFSSIQLYLFAMLFDMESNKHLKINE